METMRNLHGILLGGGIPLLLYFAFSVQLDSASPIADEWTSIAMPDTVIVNLFKEECASCHGEDGKGQTRAGRRAGVEDFTDAEYQATWTDDEAFNVVMTATKDGEELKNKKPFADKLTEEQIKLLVQHVRTFASN